MRRLLIVLSLLVGLVLPAGLLAILPPPPPAGDPYTPIQSVPGLSGPQFRAAVDQRFNGSLEIDPQLGTGTTRPQGTVASLPVLPFRGERYDVTDCVTCTFGQTCAGGGAVPLCLEVFNGNAWVAY